VIPVIANQYVILSERSESKDPLPQKNGFFAVFQKDTAYLHRHPIIVTKRLGRGNPPLKPKKSLKILKKPLDFSKVKC